MVNLPKLKKKVLGFITEEDAKIVERKTAKISFIAASTLVGLYIYSHSVYAGFFSHSNHCEHSNNEAPSIGVFENYHNFVVTNKWVGAKHWHHNDHDDSGSIINKITGGLIGAGKEGDSC